MLIKSLKSIYYLFYFIYKREQKKTLFLGSSPYPTIQIL